MVNLNTTQTDRSSHKHLLVPVTPLSSLESAAILTNARSNLQLCKCRMYEIMDSAVKTYQPHVIIVDRSCMFLRLLLLRKGPFMWHAMEKKGLAWSRTGPC